MAAAPTVRDGPSSASWFSPLALERQPGLDDGPPSFTRLWLGFMTARVMIAIVLLLLQGSLYVLGQAVPGWLIGLCVLYLTSALGVRLLARPQPPGRKFDTQWLFTIGLDVVAISMLQLLQASGSINYTPLFAMPVLLASVLGSPALALGTAAMVTLALLGNAWWLAAAQQGDMAGHLLQTGLTGTGLFILAFLTNQLAARLARAEQLSRRSRTEARAQILVNELVIESLTDGVLVVDTHNVVRAANPAARQLLGRDRPAGHAPFALGHEHAWRHLADLAQLSFASGHPETAELTVHYPEQPERHLQARTRLTAAQADSAHHLCVMFLQDLREMEARLRHEKLAAMGRMSAAVAHEIRNPLAAITQANALLAEDLTQPTQQRLTTMIGQNAQRLSHIVGEILDVTRVQHLNTSASNSVVTLDELAATTCRDWMQQNGCAHRVSLDLRAGEARVMFDADHLRRVLVNLLDNALRYASHRPDAIQVATRTGRETGLTVWSDGAPLEPTVQRHLFEPFFSSESRSSGLGLYICRELCERHGAVIGHERTSRPQQGGPAQGNEFLVTFRRAPTTDERPPRPATRPLPV